MYCVFYISIDGYILYDYDVIRSDEARRESSIFDTNKTGISDASVDLSPAKNIFRIFPCHILGCSHC